MSERKSLHTFAGDSSPRNWTWRKIREYMQSKYGSSYTEYELRAMEIKWKKAFAEVGWSVKGE